MGSSFNFSPILADHMLGKKDAAVIVGLGIWNSGEPLDV
jgi:hypothetical protein